MKLLEHLADGIERWQRNRARTALERLDDRQLAEIGLARNDIPWAVEGLFLSENRSIRTPSPSFRAGRLPKPGRLGARSQSNEERRHKLFGGNDGYDNEDNHRGRHVRTDGRGVWDALTSGN